MHKTLLLCFIHGFKGDDNTFCGFPDHLRALVSHALPRLTIKVVTYPQFETRGDLGECVGRFREWSAVTTNLSVISPVLIDLYSSGSKTSSSTSRSPPLPPLLPSIPASVLS
ncbi:MAG: hypothetical protein Q9190_006006 [Brigantiaea leucoxantha]